MQPNYSQRQFADTVLNADLPTPTGVVDPRGNVSPKRFDVYRNNVVVSLIEAMCDAFPAILNITGEEFFKAVAREFVIKNPPTSPLMMFYGQGFDAFLGSFEPTQSLAFLPDVAKIEMAWRRAYHAADVDPLQASELGRLTEEQLAAAQFSHHPSVNLIHSAYAAVDMWKVARGHQPADTMSSGAQIGLICRAAYDVHVEAIDRPTADLLECIQTGATFGSAVEVVLMRHPDFNLSHFISNALRLGLLTLTANS